MYVCVLTEHLLPSEEAGVQRAQGKTERRNENEQKTCLGLTLFMKMGERAGGCLGELRVQGVLALNNCHVRCQELGGGEGEWTSRPGSRYYSSDWDRDSHFTQRLMMNLTILPGFVGLEELYSFDK